VTDIVAFLRARLDEDQAVAQSATPGPWVRDALDVVPEGEHSGHTVAEECHGDADADHISRHDPAHVLADIASKRLIIDVVPPPPGAEVPDTGSAWDYILRLLTLPYATHPDYREEWRP